jgi:iron complex outermembrane receptor protein
MKCLFLLLAWTCIFQKASAQSSADSSVRKPQDSSAKVSRDSSTGAHRNPFTQTLGELVIRAAKPPVQQQPYGTTVNVGSSILDKGSSVLEVLQRSPGVLIDQRTSNITLNGKSGVAVMLDGKLMHMSGDQLLTLLGSMSADDIEKIELLTTPPSSYDAEGAAGVINIVLKKTKKKGTSGSLSLTAGHGWGEKGSAAVHLAHNTEKIATYGSYSFSHDRTIGTLIASGTESVPVFGGHASFDYLGITHRLNDSHNATLGLDAILSPKITAGGSISYNNSGSSSVSTNQDIYTIFTDSVLRFSGTVNGHSRWTNTITSVYAEKKIREGEKLNLGLDYLSYHNNAPTSVNSSFRDSSGHEAGTNADSLFGPRQKGFSGTSIQVGVARLDYTRPLGRRIKLETGLKGNYTASSSSSGIESLVNGAWVASLGTTDNIDMKEGIAAAYLSVNTRLSASASLVTGVRYEYSRTRLTEGSTGAGIVDRRLGTFFPSLFLSKKINDHAEAQLSYTRRITRPSYNDLASYIEYNDPISVFTGNPLLKPAITDNLKLGFNFHKYSASILLSRDTDPIAEYQITKNPSGSLVYISPQNLSFQDNLTFQTNLPWKVNEWLDMNGGFTGGWRRYRIDYTPQPGEVTYFGWSANLSGSFRLPRNFLLEISGYYNSFSYYGNSSSAGYAVLNGGIKKELKNNKGNFQLSVSDLFSSQVYNGHLGVVTTDAYATRAHVRYKPESATFPILKLTYTRSFGSAGTKKDQPDNGPKEENDRIR